ncbi:SusD/RagB family nutrient-binding outer membrane lipoprotein [Marivirga lumbricoides]
MKKTLILFTCFTICFGCTKVDDLLEDPNRATSVTPDLILTNLEIQAFNNVSLSAALASRYLTFTDNIDQYQYYGWQRSNFSDYDNLKQSQKMIEEAKRTNIEVYQILGDFFKAYFTIELTQVFGDIPFTQALSVEDGILTPEYDQQKEIYLKVLDMLKNASIALSSNTEPINGDIIYFGDKLKWRKLINSYSLRVLMSLSNKTDEGSLDIINRFNEIVSNLTEFPVFTSNEDNADLEFVNVQGNRYPLFNSNSLQTAYYLEKSFVERLQTLQDPRLFVFADKKPSAADATNGDFTAYGGLYGSAELSVNAAEAVSGEASRINSRYYSNPVNEPSILMSYAELSFILAESAVRNWTTVNVNDAYEAGITASMEFYGISINSDYLGQDGVKLNEENEIASILTQKHIAMFLNTGWQIFYEQRRTGFPEFNIDGGGILNAGKIPKRWMYPESELVNNNKNLQTAIQRQFSGGDNINGNMWLLQ